MSRVVIPLALLVALVQSPVATAQSDSTTTTPVVTTTKPAAFNVGERMDYVAKWGKINPGRGSMEIVGIEDVRGKSAVHTRFQLKGKALWFSASYMLDSWVDRDTFTSLRFTQDNDDDPSDKNRVYEIFPDRKTYMVNGGEELASVSDPLDEGALLLFVRTMELEVGKTYQLDRYFRPDRNPVIVKVVRKERIKVPAGTYNTIVIQPIIKSKGIFSEGGKAHIYLSDDKDRIMVQMRVHLKANIEISLQITNYRPAANPTQ